VYGHEKFGIEPGGLQLVSTRTGKHHFDVMGIVLTQPACRVKIDLERFGPGVMVVRLHHGSSCPGVVSRPGIEYALTLASFLRNRKIAQIFSPLGVVDEVIHML
jgi:hypothetical protein